ncbi:BTAD domain-containing putative transcriptional regulator [Nonomuraea sp. NPDC005650]|uniref:BTAD domain-containing putative transcriptional regulator n=1 Tax=Nonomuraea sp. NPDC005650 TaxID=3157045 RepID=UPI0033B5259C
MLLGPFEVRDGEERRVEISGARLCALVARLALEPGRVVSFEVLTAAIWGERPPTGSANALQSLVSRTRRLVGHAAIESHPAGYRLAIDADDVDVSRFERLAGTGSLAALRQAEGLWRGPALADLAGLPFADNAAVRLDELRLSAAEDRLELELGAGNDVLAELGPLAAAHPLRERLQGLLMRALYAAGRQADALDAYERTRRTLSEELGVDPSAGLAELHLSILRHDPQHQDRRRARRSNLRAQVTSFVGREQELAQLAKALETGRLVTVVGPGGAGKTRLAVEVAQRSADLAPDGVWLAELAPVTDPHDVANAVLTAVGGRDGAWFEAGAGGAAERLTEVFAQQGALLLLDNCEHVVSAVAELVDRLLGACPDLRVLATSRESLAVAGESLYPIPPLEWPAGPGKGMAEDARDYSAVRLFTERAVSVRPDFTLDETTAGAVVEICRRLDGMPLAIELAAARMRALSVEQIAAKLDDRFRLLSSGSRTALPRHRTLQAVVDWSWDPLPGEERELAMVLAAFPGGATLEALEAVSGLDPLDALTALVDKSLVELSGGRYRMQETVRSYGTARLAESGQDAAVRDGHARYFLRLAEAADPELRGAGQLGWLARLRAEHDNFLAALRFAADTGDAELGVRLPAALWWFWFLWGLRVESVHWTRGVLDLPGEVPEELRPVRLAFQGLVHQQLGDPVAAQEAIQEALDLGDRLGGPPGVLLLCAPMVLGDLPVAARAAERSLPGLTGWERAFALMTLSMAAESKGDVGGAFTLVDETRREMEALGERWGLSSALRVLAEHHDREGDLTAGIEARSRALRLAGELGVVEDQAAILAKIALSYARSGEHDRARSYMDACWDCVERLRRPEGVEYVRLSHVEVLLRSGALEEARRELPALEDQSCPPEVRAWAACYRAMAALLDGDRPGAGQPLDTALDTAMDTAMELGDLPILAAAAHVRAAALADDEPARAAYLLGAATALLGTEDRSGFGDLLRPAERARAALGDAAFAAAYERGATLTRDAAISAVRPA